MARIGLGDISPNLFSLSQTDFLGSFSDEFKRLLLPGMTDKQIEKEFVKLYKENQNGTTGLGEKTEPSTDGVSSADGEVAE